MPRHARFCLADTPFHVTHRGNNRAACFFSDRDRRYYLDQLGRHAAAEGVAVHAYVLMTNHVHHLMTPRDNEGVSRVMQAVAQHYTQYINRTYGRSGTLWEGRFHSSLVEAEGYLLTCHRYIESNPVRAGLAVRPADYAWSSYRSNAEGERNPLLSLHPIVAALGVTPDERRAAYRELFEREIEPPVLEEIRASARGGFVLGSSGFQQALAGRFQARVARGHAGRPFKRNPSQHGGNG